MIEIEGVDFVVGLVLLILVPIVVMLIESVRHENRLNLLEAEVLKWMGIVVEDENPRKFLEADLEKEVNR